MWEEIVIYGSQSLLVCGNDLHVDSLGISVMPTVFLAIFRDRVA
jgi:hypothetical protein